MERLVETLVSNDVLTEEAARQALLLLVPIAQEAPEDPDVVDALRSVIARVPSGSVLAALADWWLVVTTGESPATPAAHHPPDSIPAAVRSTMTSVIHLGTKLPPARWLGEHRRLLEILARLDEKLDYDSYGAVKIPGERQAWTEVLELLAPTVEALRDGRAAPVPQLDSERVERAMRNGGIESRSNRWYQVIRRADELVEFLAGCVALQAHVEPWRRTAVPELLDSTPDLAIGPGRTLERILIGPALSSVEPLDLREETIAGLRAAATATTDRGRTRLAQIVDVWIERTRSEIPELAATLARLARVRQQIERTSAMGAVTDDALLALMDDDLDAAEQALGAVKADVERAHRREQVERQLAGLERRWADADADAAGREIVAAQLPVLRDLLDRDDLEACEREVNHVNDAANSAVRDRLRSELDVIVADLERLDASEDVLADARETLDDVASSSGRVGQAQLLRHREAFEELRRQRLGELRDEIEELDRMLAAIDELPGSAKNDLGDDVASLRVDLELLEAMPSLDDLVVALERVHEARDELDQLRQYRWDGDEERLIEHLVEYCTQELHFADLDIRRFFVSLKTKPFVILAGLTGSGKSTLVRLFAQALGANGSNGRFRRVAVRPDWIDQSEVLGYINPMSNRFCPGWLADVAVQCQKRPDSLHVVLLDEMNLAPVEQYLAEYLSAAEEARSGSTEVRIPLYPNGSRPENDDEWRAEVPFPSNLLLVGTINVDETTRVLSDRVLDRANVMQLDVAIDDGHHGRRRVPVRSWEVPYAAWRRIVASEPSDLHHEYLVELADIMRTDLGIGLGIRSHVEIERFVANSELALTAEEALDFALLQRVIPKVRGFKRELQHGLERLRGEFDSVGATKCMRVVDNWLDPRYGPDEYLDGTAARVGMLG